MLKKVLLGGALLAQAALPTLAQRHCATPTVSQLSPVEQAALQQIERHTQRYLAQQATNPTANRTATVVTIPVVVHVVYNTAAQNISDAIIQSQIDVLNKDFSRTNTDAGNTPAAFSGLASNMEIQFALATRDPNGAATTGIVRKSTTRTYFEYGGSDVNGVFVKQSANGGDDAWNTTQYLNLWVCNFGGSSTSLLGYATFPSDAGTYKDGVVIGYKYFGVNPSLGGVFGYGRTATHEVGHWVNLRHIWGDANCGDDLVSDTPTQQTSNGGCPAFPHKTCGNTTNGDMFMNYMDYVDDQCMNMFSAGQKARSQALFVSGGARFSLTTSPGLGGGTTSCGVPTGLSSSSITSTGATVSWTAISGATSYNVQYKTAAASTWTTTTSTSASKALSGLSASTTYNVQVQAVCASGSSAYSTAASFTTSATGGITYCASKGTNVSYEYIDKVAMGTLSRTSGADAGYYDGTALSTSAAQGASQTITLSAGYVSSAYTEYFNVWVDFNKNGVFTDAGEQVVTNKSNAASAGDVTATFTVPATATVGTTRMRVSMSDASGLTSCSSFTYGEVEDYSVNITAGGGTSCGTPTGLTVGSITSSGATASWTAVSGATSYSVQYKTTAASTWTTLTSATTSVALTGLAASTGYNVQVAAVCSGTTGAYSAAVSFTTTAVSAPTYCASKGTSVAYEYIDLVAIGAISRTSTADAGYYNGSAASTSVAAGSSQTISFSAGFVSTAYTEYFRIYCDWNNNGVFTDAGETLYAGAGSSSAATQSASFTVPATALNGAHRLRVVMSDASATNSCGSYSYGETEDYTLTVTGGARYATAAIGLTGLSVFPNPTQGDAKLRFSVSTATAVTITVRDLQGRLVSATRLDVPVGLTEQALPKLAAGLYVVGVRGEGTEQQTKLVVTE